MDGGPKDPVGENRGLKSRIVLATTPMNEQPYRYAIFIRVSEFQTFLHNADCQLKHSFWLTLCSVKNAVVGCQPVPWFTGVNTSQSVFRE